MANGFDMLHFAVKKTREVRSIFLPLRERDVHTFRCPECKVEVLPVNVQCITCPNCAYSGTKDHFSAIERAA
jgi:uncharacterized protein (DUF2225 family)